MEKRVFLVIAIIATILIGIFLFNKPTPTGTAIQNVEIVPLSQEEREKVFQTVSSSEFIKDIPEKNPIALTFYSFEGEQRIWRDGFLINNQGFLTEGEPTVYLSLHSKYISELNEGNLCGVIRKAKENGDLGFQSGYGKARLLIKYAGMLKHRGCFGF